MAHTVWVSGASSQLGVFLLPRLRAAGFRVRALSRRAPQPPVAVADGVWWARPDDTAFAGHAASGGEPALHSVSGYFDLVAMGVVPTVAEMDELTDRIGAIDGMERTTSSIILSAKFER